MAAPRSPSIGGTDARVPVASTTACRAVSVRVSPAGSVTSTVLSPVSRPRPRTMSMPAPFAHCTCELSSWCEVNASRRASTAATSTVRPSSACCAPGSLRAVSSTSTGRSSALLGMQAQ